MYIHFLDCSGDFRGQMNCPIPFAESFLIKTLGVTPHFNEKKTVRGRPYMTSGDFGPILPHPPQTPSSGVLLVPL